MISTSARGNGLVIGVSVLGSPLRMVARESIPITTRCNIRSSNPWRGDDCLSSRSLTVLVTLCM